jgi:hypothetical protein
MASLSPNILILLVVSCLASLVVPLFKDKVWKQVCAKNIIPAAMRFGVVLVPFGVMFGIIAQLGADLSSVYPAFFGAALLAFLLSRLNLPAQLRGILLLAASVAFTAHLPAQGNDIDMPVCSALAGLLIAKLTDNLYLSEQSSLDDILPSLFWLGGIDWISNSGLGNAAIATQMNILLSIIAVVILLKSLQGPFLSDDKILLKRLILSTTGGLGVLIVLNKLLLATSMSSLALLVGGGILATYLFINTESEDATRDSTRGIKLLIVVGMLTIVATRFFGMFGLVALAPAALVAPRTGIAQYGGLFFVMRALLQSYVQSYNSNVTGINLTHAYTSAALYAGFFIVVAMMLLLRDIKDKRLLLAAYLGGAVLVPIGANYFLHAEPASSFLVACTVAGTLLAILGPALAKTEFSGYENVMLLPVLMVCTAVISGGLITAGESTTIAVKTTMMSYALGFVVFCSIVIGAVIKFTPKGPQPAPSNEH